MSFVVFLLASRYGSFVKHGLPISGVLLNVSATVILLVDDDASIRKGLRRLLSIHGYEVYEASDCVGAMEQARERRPHVMILDLHMPRLTGLDLAHELRADPGLSAIALIAFSASVPDWDEDLKLFDQVIEKPASAEVLLEAIEKSMERTDRRA